MKQIKFPTSGVCSSLIQVELDESGLISSAKFHGGCPGNSLGVSRLVVGMTPASAIAVLDGIRCPGGGNVTSCPDQLAKALKELQA